MVKCAECEIRLPQNAKFCPNCGTQIGLQKRCLEESTRWHCGEKSRDNSGCKSQENSDKR